MDILIVAPPGVRVSIRSNGDALDVHRFESLEHFDRWRGARDAETPSLGVWVDRAAEEARAVTPFSPQMAAIFAWLRIQTQVPCLKQLAEAVTSRRSFFRLWSREMSERPSAFLDRVRAHYARQLLAAAAEPLETIARRAGYPSVAAMQEASSIGTTSDAVALRGR